MPLALVAGLLAAASAALPEDPPPAPVLDLGPVRVGEGRYAFEEVVLDNGLRVLTLEDHSAPIVALQLWYHVGSKDEDPARTGFAHLFEHMMFRGTDRLGPKDHFELIRRAGGTVNAYTTFDQTVYHQVFPSNQLELVLWLEAERMAALAIDEGGFATEVRVVQEERRLGLDQPYGSLPEKVLPELFGEHPYRWMPIGTIEHLEAATVQEVQDFWDRYYVPNNATLVMVGDLDHEQARQEAARAFSWIPRCDDPPRVSVVEPAQEAPRAITIEEDDGPVPLAGLVYRGPPVGHPDAVGLDMLVQILAGGESSRVYVDAVRRERVAMVALGAYVGLEDAGLVIVGGASRPGPFADTDGLIASIREQVARVREEGVTEAELEKARNQALAAAVSESLTVDSKASALGRAAVLLGDAQEANRRLERVRAVTTDELHHLAETWLVPERATAVTVEPSLGGMLRSVLTLAGGGDGEPAEAPPGSDEEVAGGARAVAGGPKADAQRPVWVPGTPPAAPPLEVDAALGGARRVLDNGLTVVAVENHEVPWIDLSLRLRVGSFTEDPDHPGTAAMAAGMVTRGTFTRDAEALAEELERHGLRLSSSSSHDDAIVSLSGVVEQARRAMRLLAEIVQVPRFDEDEFATLRDQTLTGMAVAESNPAVMADRAFDAALWGGHPYGRPSQGTSEDVRRLDVERCAAWWDAWVRPDTAVLYVSGDVAAEDAFALADRYLGSWDAAGAAPRAPRPDPEPPARGVVTLVDRPGAIQSQIRAGHEGIVRADPRHAAGQVLTQVFGGGFTSRLNDVLRVEKGLTYGASGGLSSRRFGGTFEVSTFTKSATTGQALRAVLDEVERMRAEPPTAEELDAALSYLTGSFASSIETPQEVAGRLWTLERDGLASDHWSRYLDRVRRVSADDVAAAARELLHPERMVLVVVGDAERVREPLEDVASHLVVREDR